MCLDRSFATLPPTHHVVLTPIGCRAANTFAKDIGKAVARLRSTLVEQVEYARIFEWVHRRIHAHVLLRVSGRVPRGLVKRVLDKVRPGGYRVSCKLVKSVPAMARYFVKHLKGRRERAELTPPNFSGRVFQASGRFLTRSLAALWRDIQVDRRKAEQER